MCTTITISKNKNYFMCKSMDFFEKYKYTFVFFPENYIFEEDIFGNNFKSKYKMMGTTFKGYDQFIDGINEFGLMGSTNSFKNEVSFENNINLKYINLTSTKLVNFFLANCKNVDEIIELSSKIRLFKKSLVNKNNFSRHYHYMFSDKNGKTIVIEFFNGKLKIYDNNLKIMTNNPKFPKHLENINSFSTKSELEKQKILSKPLISPSRRFIKAYYITKSLKEEDFNNLNLFSFLNNFSITKSNFSYISNYENTTITVYQSILNSNDKTYEFKYYNSNLITKYDFEKLKNIKYKFIDELKK